MRNQENREAAAMRKQSDLRRAGWCWLSCGAARSTTAASAGPCCWQSWCWQRSWRRRHCCCCRIRSRADSSLKSAAFDHKGNKTATWHQRHGTRQALDGFHGSILRGSQIVIRLGDHHAIGTVRALKHAEVSKGKPIPTICAVVRCSERVCKHKHATQRIPQQNT